MQGGDSTAYTVKAVSDWAGITIRTLHHYDAIGLLKPAQVTTSGYRLYTEADLERLQQILFFRELGFGLQEIKEIIGHPGFDRRQALLDHRDLLLARRQRLDRLIQTIDRTLEAMKRGRPMDEKELFEGFDPAQYEEEARQRWGHTPAWAESQRRARKYTPDDWRAIQQECREIDQGTAALLDRSPADPEVQGWIQRHHRQINDRFYTCTPEMYRGLGDLYVQDPRFTARYEEIKPGMARFMQAAIQAYCDRLEGR